MTIKELEPIFDTWLINNTNLIIELKNEFSNDEFMEELYGTGAFEELVNSVNNNTKDESEFINGWTDEKDELFYNKLKQLIS